ncbi:MAG: CusA/CzcA family heavy metal efflux RND transporter [Planctomycetaceae bacterium]|nr:CusA/CzcA family heavy metal efflux RND transporter [Planctomycetaceae bacterium]
MLDAVIRAALRYRVLVVLGALTVMLYGTYLATTMPIDVLPDLDRPRVVLLVECPGMAPEEVEARVAHPIETSILGANGVQAVRGQCTAGLAVIFAEFSWEMEVRAARQTVQERLATVLPQLPPGVLPQMMPTSSIMGQVMQIGVTSKDGTTKPMELGTLANWVIRPRLLKIPGVAEVIVLGGEKKQYQVLLNPDALRKFEVTVPEVEAALRASNLNTTGGFDLQGDAERPIRVLAQLGPDPARVIADLLLIVVKPAPPQPHEHEEGKFGSSAVAGVTARPILLQQVARVVEGPELKRGDASVDGVPGVVLTVVKQPHADTRAVTAEVHAAIRELERTFPKDVVVNHELFQLKNFIDRAVYNVGEALVVGAGLVLIVLTLFLMNVRTTFISLTAIPLSLAVTAIVFKLIGRFTGTELSINVMTLGGIAVAMGELVDDAIVDVENIFRRLRENNLKPEAGTVALSDSAVRQHPLRVVYEASREIRSAIVFGTLVVVLVFLPLFALSGVEGRLFATLGLAYIVSILASLLVSITVTPVAAYYLLANSHAVHAERDGPLLRLLKFLTRPLIRFSMNHPMMLLLLTWAAVAVAGWQMSRLGADFLPPFDEGSVQVNVSVPPGSSLEASNHLCRVIDARLKTLQKTDQKPQNPVLHFTRRTGRAERDEHTEPVNRTEYILSMNTESGLTRQEAIKQILADLKDVAPGADVEAEQPLAHMISHMVSGVYAQVAIKIYGDDLDILRREAERVKSTIASIPGVTPPVVEMQQATGEVHIRLRPADLAFHGLTRDEVSSVVKTALQGEEVSQVIEGQRRFDLIVRLDDEFRTDLPRLGKLRIERIGRPPVLLGEVADIGDATGPNAVNRENVRRRIIIRCNVQSRDLASVVEDIQKRVEAEVKPGLPAGYSIDYGGQFESQRRATRLIAVLAAVSVVGMFAVLMVLFPSVRIVLQILNALPTAFIGGVLALVLTNQTLTVASLVGFISLGGIAVRNGILLVAHYMHLMREEGQGFTKEVVLRGSLERLAPVLMTALTAGIALVPLVFEGLKPGREILYPVATVILGGLLTSTFCEFLIHPGLFWRFSGQDAERLARSGLGDDPLADTELRASFPATDVRPHSEV